MPYRSSAQRGKFHAMLERGQISPSVVHEFDEASKGMELPEHAEPQVPYRTKEKKRGTPPETTARHCHANGKCHAHPDDKKDYG